MSKQIETKQVKGNSTKRSYWRKPAVVKRGEAKASSRFLTKSAARGGRFVPSSDPPDVTGQPWFPVTLVWLINTKDIRQSIVDFKTIVLKLQSQLDPTERGFNPYPFDSVSDKPLRVQFRLLRVSVWNLSGRTIGLSVADDLDYKVSDVDQLGGWLDCGGSGTFPKLGFSWPLSHQSRVHRPSKDQSAIEVFRVVAGSSDTCLIHLSILWKFDGPVAAVRLVDDIVFAINQGVRNIHLESTATNVALKSMNDKLDLLIDAQPSTAQKVINGALSIASYVIPLAVAEDKKKFQASSRDIVDFESLSISIPSRRSSL